MHSDACSAGSVTLRGELCAFFGLLKSTVRPDRQSAIRILHLHLRLHPLTLPARILSNGPAACSCAASPGCPRIPWDALANGGLTFAPGYLCRSPYSGWLGKPMHSNTPCKLQTSA